VKKNRYVKFVGNREALLHGLPEKEELFTFFEKTNRFLVTDKINEMYEIFIQLEEDKSHFFYVSENDIETV
jgi:hypothetical protein